MYLWGESIRDDEFATEINKITAKDICIVMEQCYSGGFIDDLAGQNRVIMTACAYNETSCGMGYYTYDEFVFDWITAISGQDPNGNIVNTDYYSDGFVSMQEAFYYAEANDACSETPQYSSTPGTLGTFLAADGSILSLSGPSTFCDQATYTINNLPQGATVTWSSDSKLSLVSGQGTGTCTVSVAGNGSSWVSAVAHINGGQVAIPQTTVWLGVPSTTIDGPASMKKGATRTYTLNNINTQGINYFSWDASGGIFPIGSTSSSTFQAEARGCGEGSGVSCIYGNNCGSGNAQFDVDVICIQPVAFTLTPNPTTDIVTITLLLPDETENNTGRNVSSVPLEPYTIQLWNERQGLVRTMESSESVQQLSVQGLSKGMYYVHVVRKGHPTLKQKLIVQ